MFEVEASDWDVDRTAEKLNTALFGSKKKQNLQKSKGPHQQSIAQLAAAVLPDSDDETFTKKGKRKLKERKRKQKKPKKGASSIHETDVTDEMSEAGMVGKEKLNGQKSSKISIGGSEMLNSTRNRKQKDNTIISHNRVNVAQKNKIKKSDPGRGAVGSPEVTSKKGKKRNLVDAEIPATSQNQQVTKKPKLSKEDSALMDEHSLDDSGEKRKKRRNRKKKNSSKKNKYKHLALNVVKEHTTVGGSEHVDSVQNTGSRRTEVESKSSANGEQPSPSNSLKQKNSPTLRKTEEKLKQKKKKSLDNESTLEGKNVVVNTKEKKKRKKILKGESDSQAKGSVTSKQMIVKKTKMKGKDTHSEIEWPKENDIVSSEQPIDSKEDDWPTSADEVVIASKTLQSQNSQGTPQKSTASYRRVKYKSDVLVKMLNESLTQSSHSENAQVPKKSQKIKGKAEKLERLSDLTSTEEAVSPLSNTGGKKRKAVHQPDMGQTLKNSRNEGHSKFSPTPIASVWGKAALLTQQAKDKLDSARFRYINEQLYNCTGNEALQMFREDKDAYRVYHDGFRNQVSKWEVNPQDVIIKQLSSKSDTLVVADFGCGDAKLAESVPQKVHSFDLVALNKRVTVCDMSKTPLPSETVDVAVFCLSLMGTNVSDYIREANRVLKPGGILKIAEVTSRFSGLSQFTSGVSSHGFQLLNKRDLSQMFYLLDFKKMKMVKKSPISTEIKLKPCIYKRR